jgi:hypothetical protein
VIIVWRDGRALVDRASVADLYGVSERSVRRHCPVVTRDPATRAALVDALAAEEHLSGVRPRESSRVYAALRAWGAS